MTLLKVQGVGLDLECGEVPEGTSYTSGGQV